MVKKFKSSDKRVFKGLIDKCSNPPKDWYLEIKQGYSEVIASKTLKRGSIYMVLLGKDKGYAKLVLVKEPNRREVVISTPLVQGWLERLFSDVERALK